MKNSRKIATDVVAEIQRWSAYTTGTLVSVAINFVKAGRIKSATAAGVAKIICAAAETFRPVPKDAEKKITEALTHSYWDANAEKYQTIFGVQTRNGSGYTGGVEYEVEWKLCDGRKLTGLRHKDRGDLMTDIEIS